MKELYREYKNTDYQQCEELVNSAWSFDEIFKPKALSSLAKLIYTKGSIVGSNYKSVVEIDGEVVGLIFGLNENFKKPRKDILFNLQILFNLIFVKSITPDKKTLLNAMSTHEKNKSQIVDNNRSEIVLFVIDKKHQGKGYGKKLWLGFRDFCIKSHVTSIVVETNKLEASTFYEQIGFNHLEDFDSPLHEFATKDGQACIYVFQYG
ncbi:MAG: GNAT family N-acetyltransferase [Bacteroidota bacterium]